MEIMDKDPLIKNEEPEITDCGNGKFICGLCSKTFSSKQSLRQHYQEIHVGNNEKTIECLASGCTKKFAVERYMKEHMKKVHDKPKVPNPVPLQENSKERERYLMLEQYIGVNNDTSLEQCNVCLKSYKGAHRSTRLRQLFDHIERSHLKLRSYACDYCSQTFNSKGQKASHISMKHSSEHKSGRSARSSDKLKTEYAKLQLEEVELNEDPEQNEMLEIEEEPEDDYDPDDVQEYDLADALKSKKEDSEISDPDSQVKLEDFLQVELEEDDNQSNLDYH